METIDPASESGSEDLGDGDSIASDYGGICEPDSLTQPDWAIPRPALYVTGRLDKDPNLQWTSDSLRVYGNTQVLNAVSDAIGPRIRLLQIAPGAPDQQQISGRLISRPMFDAPAYIALSYSWGSAAASTELLINGHPFPVSTHLWNAHRRLRKIRGVVNVWVDAICINQQNPLDKASQVQIMSQIYNAADEVRVWLGDMEESNLQDDPELFWSLCQQPQPWWRRLWILQECAHARACPIVMIHDFSMSLQQFVQRWAFVAEHCTASDRRLPLREDLDFLRMPYNAWLAQVDKNTHRLPLLQRLRETVGRQCSDPRDKIYALLSLVTESEAQKIPLDYRKSYETLQGEVYKLLKQSKDWDSGGDGIFQSVLPTTAVLSARMIGASDQGEEREVRGLLYANAVSPTGMKEALRAASARGHRAVVELLLHNGASAELHGADALCAASVGGHESVVMLLLEAGVNPNMYIKREEKPRATSAASEDVHDSAPMIEYYFNALHFASEAGHPGVVALLLKAGAELDTRREAYHQAQEPKHNELYEMTRYRELYSAAAAGHREVVRLLINAGADVNAEGGMYGNPLQAASVGNHYEIVRQLLAAGADINAWGGKHRCALYAALCKCRPEVVKLLMDAGADLNVQGIIRVGLNKIDWYMSIYTASAAGSLQLVKLLMDTTADANANGNSVSGNLYIAYCIALQRALLAGHQEFVGMLVDTSPELTRDDQVLLKSLIRMGQKFRKGHQSD